MGFKRVGLPLLLLCAAAPAWASRRRRPPVLPEAEEVLRRSLEPSAASYEGEVRLETFAGPKASAKRMTVRSAGKGLYRREVLDQDGDPAEVVVSDGKVEWIYDRGRGKAWRGSAVDSEDERSGAEEERDLLDENYEARVSTAAPVARRGVWRLDLRSRSDGALNRSLWVDKKSGLVLRRLAYRPDGAPASEMRFTRLYFSKAQDRSLFAFTPPPGTKLVERLEPDHLALNQAKAASGLDPRTPAWLPSGYVFESLDVLPHGRKKIVHYRYSDGINALSFFQCPPRVRLDFGDKGGRRVRLSSGSGTVAWTGEGTVLGWSAGRAKFVLVGQLPEETLRRVAESVR